MELGTQIADGLDAAHSKGMCIATLSREHFCDRARQAKILDLGWLS